MLCPVHRRRLPKLLSDFDVTLMAPQCRVGSIAIAPDAWVDAACWRGRRERPAGLPALHARARRPRPRGARSRVRAPCGAALPFVCLPPPLCAARRPRARGRKTLGRWWCSPGCCFLGTPCADCPSLETRPSQEGVGSPCARSQGVRFTAGGGVGASGTGCDVANARPDR